MLQVLELGFVVAVESVESAVVVEVVEPVIVEPVIVEPAAAELVTAIVPASVVHLTPRLHPQENF